MLHNHNFNRVCLDTNIIVSQGKPPVERQTTFQGASTQCFVPPTGLSTTFTVTWSNL